MVLNAMLLSVATAAVSYFIVRAEFLDRPRSWLTAKSGPIGKLIGCGYCLSHWVAAMLVVACDVRLFGMPWSLDYALTILVVAWLASFQYAAMDRLW